MFDEIISIYQEELMYTKKQSKPENSRIGRMLLASILLLSIGLSACGQNGPATSTPTPAGQSRRDPFPLDLTFKPSTDSSAPDGWGWGVTPGNAEQYYDIAFEPQGGPNGEPAVLVHSTAPVDYDYNSVSLYRLLADIKNFAGHRVRLSADVKAEGVAWQATLWMIVNGFGDRTLAYDSMWMRPIAGTKNWQRYEIVLDIPPNAEKEVESVYYGFGLAGPGRIWVSNMRMEAVDADVPITDFLAYEPEPTNLDFETVGNGLFPGWQYGGRDISAYIIEADAQTMSEGAQSLTIHSASAAPEAWAGAWQRVAVGIYEGQQIRLTAQVKTDSVSGEASAGLEYNGRHFYKSPRDLATSPVFTGTNDWTTVELFLDLAEGTETIHFFFALTGAGQIWVDDVRLEAVGPSAWTLEQEKIKNYLNEVLDLMESNSLRRAEVDWPALRAEVFALTASAVETADTYDALRLAVEMLGDGHSRFLSPEEAQVMLGGKGENQTPTASLVSEQFGYLWLPGYLSSDERADNQHAEQIQSIIAEVDKAEPCGWVVDLRQNGGGAMWPMLAGVGPLLTEGQVGRFIDRDGQVGHWIYRGGQAGTRYEGFEDYIITTVSTPYQPTFSERPVAVLIGPNTGSSGEAIVVAFHGQSNTRFFGQPTAGVSTGNSSFYLSDGSVLVLTTTIMADRFGQQFGQAIEPDMLIDPEAGSETDTTLNEAIAWLQDLPQCQNR
jgi:carboxyl-terminal processing protease